MTSGSCRLCAMPGLVPLLLSFIAAQAVSSEDPTMAPETQFGSGSFAASATPFFFLQSSDKSAEPAELSVASVHFGKNDPGQDHCAVRIAGADCDLTVIYGMDFPMGRGPIGRKGQIHALDDEEARRFFPSMADKQISHPWIRIRGRMEKVVRGSVLIAAVAGNIAQGELQLETASGEKWQGSFLLPVGAAW